MSLFSDAETLSEKRVTSTPKCGGACTLCNNCNQPYQKPYGTGKIPVLYVGSKPSKIEDNTKKRMTGDCATLLKRLSKQAGIPVQDCTKTNAVRCYTPHPLEDYEIESCHLFVKQLIEKLQPEVIIPVGTSAIKSIISPEYHKRAGSFQQWVGKTIPSLKYNCWICPTYHPEFILEKGDEVLPLLMRKHLRSAFDLLGSRPNMDWNPQDEIEVIYDPDEAVKRINKYQEIGGTIAFDYETTGLKPDADHMEIISNSICYNGTETIAYMMNNKKVWRATKRLLLTDSTQKIASNMKFEDRWTQAKMGRPVNNWIWDTMIMAHVLDNRRGITSIKYQTYVKYGIGDYDSHISPYLKSEESNKCNNIKKLDTDALLLYNGLDSLFEFKIAVLQMREAGIPWASDKPKREKKKRVRR